jgi:hypothetical protein
MHCASLHCAALALVCCSARCSAHGHAKPPFDGMNSACLLFEFRTSFILPAAVYIVTLCAGACDWRWR